MLRKPLPRIWGSIGLFSHCMPTLPDQRQFHRNSGTRRTMYMVEISRFAVETRCMSSSPSRPSEKTRIKWQSLIEPWEQSGLSARVVVRVASAHSAIVPEYEVIAEVWCESEDRIGVRENRPVGHWRDVTTRTAVGGEGQSESSFAPETLPSLLSTKSP